MRLLKNEAASRLTGRQVATVLVPGNSLQVVAYDDWLYQGTALVTLPDNFLLWP